MADRKRLSLWRLIVAWVLVVVLAAIWISFFADGYVVAGRSKIHYTRSADPVVYWLIMLWYGGMTGYFAYCLVRTKIAPPPSAVVEPDRTPRDWMGNPLDRK